MVEKWKNVNSEALGDYRIFKIRQDTNRSPRTGHDHSFYVLESADWINIIPVTSEGKVVLIHQFRHGTKEITLEIPGGIVDADDSSAAAAARREMLEETGYDAREIVPIGTVTPNPAFLDNRCHTFLALGARRVAAPQFDGAEDIAVEEVAMARIPALITSGAITHALVVAAFYFYEQYRAAHGAISTDI